MKLNRSGGAAAASLVIGLAFLAAGALLIALAPYRSLNCVHPERPVALACASAATSDVIAEKMQCPLLPDIQCRLEANILGVIPSFEQNLTGIQDFELSIVQTERNIASKRKYNRTGAKATLLFVTTQGPIDLGWHASEFAKRKYNDQLMALARSPLAARLELIESRTPTVVIGFFMVVLGLMATSSGFSARR